MSIFDLGGGGTGNPMLDSIFTPDQLREQKRQELWTMLTNLGAGLSSTRGIAPGIAQGAMMFQQAKALNDDKLLKQALAANQLAQAQQKQQVNRAVMGMFAGGQPPAGTPDVSRETSGSVPAPSGGVFDIPEQFKPQVLAAAQKHGVAPELLASTFWNESRWNPGAINKNDQGPGVHSIGLGQWGEQWAKARGFDPRDPNASIDQTAAAMAEYSQKYGGNPLLARLAYGWGPGNVDMWLKSGGDPNRIPEGAKIWLPRTAFGLASDQDARAAFDKVAPMLRPGPVQMAWGGQPQQSNVVPAQYTPGQAPETPRPTGPTAFQAMLPMLSPQERGIAMGLAAEGKFAEALDVANKAWDRAQKARQQQVTEANQDVIIGSDGKPRINQTAVQAKGAVTAQQGVEAERIKIGGTMPTQVAKQDAERLGTFQTNAASARSLADQAAAATQMLQNAYTGVGGEYVQKFNKTMTGLGFKIEGTSEAEAAQAILAKVQPFMRVAGSGATSDYEMRQFAAALPSLLNTPQGNAKIADFLERLAQRSEQVQALAEKHFMERGALTGTDFQSQIKALGPLYKREEFDAMFGGQTPKQTPAGQPTGQAPASPAGPWDRYKRP